MKYDNDILDKLDDLGFSGNVKQPIPTYQDADCDYSWLH